MGNRFRILTCVVILLSSLPVLGADLQLKEETVRRRQAVMARMNQGGMLILVSAERRHYSGDVEYEFRQDNYLYYLTGIQQHGIALVLMPQNIDYQEILFLPDRDTRAEIWSGKMLSPQEAREISGVKNVWSIKEFQPFLESVLAQRVYRQSSWVAHSEFSRFFQDLQENRARLYLLLDELPGLGKNPTVELQLVNRLRERFFGFSIHNAANLIRPLRLVKSDYEIQELRRAVQITEQALQQAFQELRPGMWEYELEALIESSFKRHSGFDAAFPSIIASGPNALVLHHNSAERRTAHGELLLLDVGAQSHHYAADVTRTVPVSGRFNKEQADIYQIVWEAQRTAAALVRPGATPIQIHQKAVEVLKDGLLRLGLITDQSGEQYRVFFPHGTTHWLGLDVHDVGGKETLVPGMVLTIEPGLYVRENAVEALEPLIGEKNKLEKVRKAVEKYRTIGVRIEDDFLVTATGNEQLSAGTPTAISELEHYLDSLKKQKRD